MLVPPQEPVSLTNRPHTAGVHQNAMLRGASAYEAHPLDQFGVSETEILLGPLSGWNIIHYFLKEIRYFQVDEATARQVAAMFKERVYSLPPGESPEELLVNIAEKEFGLAQLHLPPSAQPIVQRLDAPVPGAPAPGLPVNGGLYQATRHLIGLGHQRIAALAWPETSRVGNDRIAGYFQALAEANLPAELGLVMRAHGSFDQGLATTTQWLDLSAAERPTALVGRAHAHRDA